MHSSGLTRRKDYVVLCWHYSVGIDVIMVKMVLVVCMCDGCFVMVLLFGIDVNLFIA